jgi:translation initiation factor 1A
MAINKKGGKKHKRNGNKHREESTINTKNVELAEDGQEYAIVLTRVGGARLKVECTDGKQRQAIIPGKLWKKVWMNPGDIILVSIDATGEKDVCYVDKKYFPREIIILKQKRLINFEEEEVTNDNFDFKTDEPQPIAIKKQVVYDLNFKSDEYEYYSDNEQEISTLKQITKKSDSEDIDDI